MKILQLVTRRQRRGAEVFATELADELAARGHTVQVLGLYAPPAEPLAPERAGWADVGGRPRAPVNPRTLAGLIRHIRRFAPDLVQANGSDTLKYAVLARRVGRGGWPLVYRNISVASHWLRGSAHRRWVRWLVGGVDHVVSVSEASAADFMRTYGVAASGVTAMPRAVRIPPAVDAPAARERLAAAASVPPGVPVLAHVGSFTPEKNHAGLLDVLEHLRAPGLDPHLVLFGDGPLRSEVAADVARRGLEGRVHLLGARADAAELAGGADVFVLPSRVEGIPGVVLEAAARGVPAVATDVGGVRQAVRDGETGRVVAPGDRDGFADAVRALLADEPARRAMGAAARAHVKHGFELGDVANGYETLYGRLIAGARR